MSWNADQRFPQFEVDGVKFMLTFQQDDDWGYCVLVLWWDGNNWAAWGGEPDLRSDIVVDIDDAKIMAHGSLREFIVWCCDEALKRAKIKAQLPLPDPNDRLARLKYNLLMSVEDNTLVVKPAPLP